MDDRLLFLYSLKDNWGSYNEKKPLQRCIVNANKILKMLESNTPEPCIIPTPKGGVQLEWSIKGFDFEIECKENCYDVLFVQGDKVIIERSYTNSAQLIPLIRKL